MGDDRFAPKIVIVGAGSLEFSSRLTADCLSYPALAGAHFALVDTDPERLAMPVEFLTESLRGRKVTRPRVHFTAGLKKRCLVLNL